MATLGLSPPLTLFGRIDLERRRAAPPFARSLFQHSPSTMPVPTGTKTLWQIVQAVVTTGPRAPALRLYHRRPLLVTS